MGKKRTKKLESKKPSGGPRIVAPSIKDDIPAEQQPPVFSLEYLQSEYSVDVCESEDRAKFSLKLEKLSQLTWSQIQSQPRHKLGYERISRNAIKPSVPRHITEDVNLIAFRFSGEKPMVGYRSGRIFYVIWLDRNFTVYRRVSKTHVFQAWDVAEGLQP